MPNAVRITSSDGFSQLFPLSWLLERNFEADDMLFQNRPNAGVTPQKKDSGLVGVEPRRVGEPVALRGWAYDYDRAIAAVELSLDNGRSWTRMATPGAEAGKVLWWDFSYTPKVCGPYELLVRAVNEDGKVGPELARYCFQVG